MAIELAYGDTMSGKSTALEVLAHHLWERSQKKTRVYIGDGGADSYNRRGLVDAGIIEILDYSSREWPMTVLKLIADYYFLKDPKDPNSKLVAPPANLFDQYGLMIFEGGTVLGQYLLSDMKGGMAWQAATGTKFGGVKDEDDVLSVRDGLNGFDDYTLQGANAPRHWQVIQGKLVSAIRSSKKFPGLVYWTAHPTEAPDKTEGGESGQYGKITGKKIIGPDFGGKAKASLIGKEFGNLLHFDTVTLAAKEKDPTSSKQITTLDREYRLYTRRHFDPNQQVMVEYVAGNRCAVPNMMPDYLVSKEPGDSILQFYQRLKDAQTSATNKGEQK